jgi:TPR repeat protein
LPADAEAAARWFRMAAEAGSGEGAERCVRPSPQGFVDLGSVACSAPAEESGRGQSEASLGNRWQSAHRDVCERQLALMAAEGARVRAYRST